MYARAAKETPMPNDPQIVKLESDVQHLQSHVTDLRADVKSLWTAVDSLKTEFLSFKADVAREFGSLKTSIERAKLWMVVTGAGTILSVWGAALALARFLKP